MAIKAKGLDLEVLLTKAIAKRLLLLPDVQSRGRVLSAVSAYVLTDVPRPQDVAEPAESNPRQPALFPVQE